MVLARITGAARTSFAEHGWAGTSMRSVAREAGVDAGLVRYYFPTKEALLDASLDPPPGFVDGIRTVARLPLSRRGEGLVRLVIANWSDPDSAASLRAGIQAAAHLPLARERVQDLFRTGILPVIADSLDDAERVDRAALVATQLVGLIVTRYIWELEPIASMSDEDVVRHLSPTVQRYLSRRI